MTDEIDIQFENFQRFWRQDLLTVPIIHQTCLKSLIALLIQNLIDKLLLAYDKVVFSSAYIMQLSVCNYFFPLG